MKELEKYYDLLDKKSLEAMSTEERKLLEAELGNLNDFHALSDKIEHELNAEEFSPSPAVKMNLDKAFEQKHKQNLRQSGIISIHALSTSSPWKMMATAASFTLVLFLSLQMGFNTTEPYSQSGAMLADSINQSLIDSNHIQVDSLIRFH